MKHISDSDYALVLRLLKHLASLQGLSVREKDMSRKAGLIARKMTRRNNNDKRHQGPCEGDSTLHSQQ